PIFEGAGLTLGAVHHHGCRDEVRAMLGHRAPLLAGGEPGAPAAAQARDLELLDERDRLELAGELQGPSTVVVVDIRPEGGHISVGQDARYECHGRLIPDRVPSEPDRKWVYRPQHDPSRRSLPEAGRPDGEPDRR